MLSDRLVGFEISMSAPIELSSDCNIMSMIEKGMNIQFLVHNADFNTFAVHHAAISELFTHSDR